MLISKRMVCIFFLTWVATRVFCLRLMVKVKINLESLQKDHLLFWFWLYWCCLTLVLPVIHYCCTISKVASQSTSKYRGSSAYAVFWDNHVSRKPCKLSGDLILNGFLNNMAYFGTLMLLENRISWGLPVPEKIENM